MSAHKWSQPEQDGVWEVRTCRFCGVRTRGVRMGDALLKREVELDGGWVVAKLPMCLSGAARDKRVRELGGQRKPWSEAQRATFQAPLRKSS